MKIFNHVILNELDFDLESITNETGRVYITPTGNIYPSVTTVLGKLGKESIEKWKERIGVEEANKISFQASTRGTNLHIACERYLLNQMSRMEMISMMPNIKKLFISIKSHLDLSLENICTLEQALYSDRLKLAGRVDCIGEWDGELAIIDFKTSSKNKYKSWIKNYFWQCTIYSEMFEELTGIKIDKIVVIISVEGKDQPQIFVQSKAEYLDDVNKFILDYHGGIL